MNTINQRSIPLEEINNVLSDTLLKVVERKISLKHATTISRLALALSKNIANTELKERVELLERILRNR